MRRLFVNAVLTGVVPEGVLLKCGPEMDRVDIIPDAWLLVDGGIIAGFGTMGMPGSIPGTFSFGRAGEWPSLPAADETIDCCGAMLMPAFCDSHTHIVYAGSREGEFLDKIDGLSYEQIASRGGGILNSAQKLHDTPEEELYSQAMERVAEMMSQGTGSIEIKSGYGLNPQDELKILRVIDRIKRTSPALVRATFLGAHAVGRGYSHEEYVDAVCDMMPQAALLADFVDVFCERGFFTTEDAGRILDCGARCGLRGKIHANQLSCSGGVQVGVRYGALSVDHLEQTGPEELAALRSSLASWSESGAYGHSEAAGIASQCSPAGVYGQDESAFSSASDSNREPACCGGKKLACGGPTIATMLPGSSFFLGLPYGHGREFIEAGLPIALASDFNPGSAPSGDMRFVMALGCIKMKLRVERAFNAATLNGAYAMGVSHLSGSITPGKRADLILTLPGWNLTRIAYLHHTPFVRNIFVRGERIV